MPVRRATREALHERLLRWWDAGHRDLPWRSPPGRADAYRVWVSEVMLQQTRVAAVVPYYRRFLERFPTLESLAGAAEDEVLALWSGLGYYARGRRLLDTAREALARHGGLPPSPEALARLPGFGPYTVGAVASIAFGQRSPCVDGNVARVLSRVFALGGAPGARATRARLWSLAGELVPAERPGDWNQALMELGATLCARCAPACARCPVEGECQAHRRKLARRMPPGRARRAVARLEVACAFVERGGEVLLGRREDRGLFGGMWELPSAEVPDGHEPRPALARGLRARYGLRATPTRELAVLERTLTHRRLVLRAFSCRDVGFRSGPRLRFARPAELANLGLPTAIRRLLEAIWEAQCGLGLARSASSTSLRHHRRAGGGKSLTRRSATV